MAPAAAPAPVPAPVQRTRPSPRARAFAKDYLIDLGKVPGTGGGVGRVTERDVRRYLETSGYLGRKITPAAFNLAKREGLELLAVEGAGDQGRVTMADVQAAAAEQPRKMSAMRRIIAERLTKSKQTIPHFYVTVAVDMTDLLALRREWKADGISYSVNSFIIKAVADSLREFPALNASVDGDSVRLKSKINVGVAVSVANGLVVPVIRSADRKAMDEIDAEAAELAGKARDGRLGPEEMRGGSFTISNMGMLGVENFAAIINPGESAILAVSASVPTPVVREGQIVVRDLMRITLSADHRVVDGAEAANFANAVKRRLERPGI
jgi:pyruvate dehydrogenase E2 component (dihydrolipoamide acetyltransferase)